MWNSLSDAVVNSSTINQFDYRLDRHWSKQEMMYRAELTEILSIEVKFNLHYQPIRSPKIEVTSSSSKLRLNFNILKTPSR